MGMSDTDPDAVEKLAKRCGAPYRFPSERFTADMRVAAIYVETAWGVYKARKQGGNAAKQERQRALARSPMSKEGGRLDSMHAAGLDAINQLEMNARVQRTSSQQIQKKLRDARQQQRRNSMEIKKEEKAARDRKKKKKKKSKDRDSRKSRSSSSDKSRKDGRSKKGRSKSP